jgi:hypothetical protein
MRYKAKMEWAVNSGLVTMTREKRQTNNNTGRPRTYLIRAPIAPVAGQTLGFHEAAQYAREKIRSNDNCHLNIGSEMSESDTYGRIVPPLPQENKGEVCEEAAQGEKRSHATVPRPDSKSRSVPTRAFQPDPKNPEGQLKRKIKEQYMRILRLAHENMPSMTGSLTDLVSPLIHWPTIGTRRPGKGSLDRVPCGRQEMKKRLKEASASRPAMTGSANAPTFVELASPARMPQAHDQPHGLSKLSTVIRSHHDDEETFAKIRAGDIEGVFLLDRPDLRTRLPELAPQAAEDLAAIIALETVTIDQPGLMEKYLRNEGPTRFPAATRGVARQFLGDTRNLILYQEQIMLMLSAFGEIELSDGYIFVREAAKRKQAVVEEYRGRFLRKASRKFGEEESEALFTQLAQAAIYACCKSHHMADATTIFQAAYLKTHHPTEFREVLGEILINT